MGMILRIQASQFIARLSAHTPFYLAIGRICGLRSDKLLKRRRLSMYVTILFSYRKDLRIKKE